MKKVVLLIITVVTISSCSLFEKPTMSQEQIDAMMLKNAQLEEDLVNMEQKYQLEKIKAEECASAVEEQAKPASADGKYSVVVGSFKEDVNANTFAAKIKQLGGSGAIIYGPSDFKFVVYSSHATLGNAAQQMEVARTNVAAEAWIWMER